MTLVDSRMGSLPLQIIQVFETMFADYRRVIVKSEFSGGFTHSRVFLVRPIRRNGRSELPCVVKVDDFDRIDQEWLAYRSCIRNQLLSVAKISGEPVYPPGNQMGGVRYPLAGDGAFDVISLEDYCQQAVIEEIAYVVQERLFKSFKPLWDQKYFQAELHLRTAYDSFLHPNLVLAHAKLSTGFTELRQLRPDNVQAEKQPFQIGDEVQLTGFEVVRLLRDRSAVVLDIPAEFPGAYRLQIQSVADIAAFEVGQIVRQPLTGRVIQTRKIALENEVAKFLGPEADVEADTLPLPNNVTLPNPLAALPKLLNHSFDAQMACIHADLHLGNVLVERESGNVHVIDFVNAREDHVLRDFLNLELAIVNRLIPVALDEAGLSSKQIIPFYERLHCALRYPGQISAPIGLEKPFAVLRVIREMAANYLFEPGQWSEYYAGLVIYLLGSLRYTDLDTIPGAKQTAFWGAAVSLKLYQDPEALCDTFLTEHDFNAQSLLPEPNQGNAGKGYNFTHVDNRSGGVYFESGGMVEIDGDVVGGSQSKIASHGLATGSSHTGSRDINDDDTDKAGDDAPKSRSE